MTMQHLGLALAILGALVMCAGFIWLLVLGFEQNLGWGFSMILFSPVVCYLVGTLDNAIGLAMMLFSPLVCVLFFIYYYKRAVKPFAIYAVGLVILVAGIIVLDADRKPRFSAEPPPLKAPAK